MGPGEENLMRMAEIIITGEKIIKRKIEPKMSINLLAILKIQIRWEINFILF
jgi:hypothetical protein